MNFEGTGKSLYRGVP